MLTCQIEIWLSGHDSFSDALAQEEPSTHPVPKAKGKATPKPSAKMKAKAKAKAKVKASAKAKVKASAKAKVKASATSNEDLGPETSETTDPQDAAEKNESTEGSKNKENVTPKRKSALRKRPASAEKTEETEETKQTEGEEAEPEAPGPASGSGASGSGGTGEPEKKDGQTVAKKRKVQGKNPAGRLFSLQLFGVVWTILGRGFPTSCPQFAIKKVAGEKISNPCWIAKNHKFGIKVDGKEKVRVPWPFFNVSKPISI